MPNETIDSAISRIEKMEALFDMVSSAISQGNPISGDAKRAAKLLSDYYSGGDWLFDYELDEKRLLPKELKRGVLSQDGLYDLLCAIGKS